MHAAGSQTEHHVANSDVPACQDFGFFYRADGKAGQVVFTGRVHARHFGRFAANQRAARELTASGNAAHDGCSRVHVQFAASEIVQEKQGLGALHQHVVHAHGHQVNAHGVMHLPLKSQAQLGAYAVGAADQHRFFVALGYFKQGAKAADSRQHAFAHGFFGQRLDTLDQGIACVNVYAGVFVGKGGLAHADEMG